MRLPDEWDYLIITAANETQAEFYRGQLALRQRLGYVLGFNNVLVIADPNGRRIGSCSSTALCLLEVLRREGSRVPEREQTTAVAQQILAGLRLLIIHSGGDSRRLPSYSACGKLFVPLPVQGDGSLQPTLFDKQLPVYQGLPELRSGTGQVVIASGDALVLFEPRKLVLLQSGITGLGAFSSPVEASEHGVFCIGGDGTVSRFLQKPSVEEQERCGAIDRYGRVLLDTGVFSFDASFAVKLIDFWASSSDEGTGCWSGNFAERLTAQPIDFYREICCALGTDTSFTEYLESVRCAGSTCGDDELRRIYVSISPSSSAVAPLAQCDFLHFGTSEDIIESGRELVHAQPRGGLRNSSLLINSQVIEGGSLRGRDGWVEGCRLAAPVELDGRNVLVGLNILQPLALARKRCVDVCPFTAEDGSVAWSVRCYEIDDSFKAPHDRQTFYCGKLLEEWLRVMGAHAEDLWDVHSKASSKDLWNARLFPAVANPASFAEWLWMFEPMTATHSQKERWKETARHSFAEILTRADLGTFMSQREEYTRLGVLASPQLLFQPTSRFSADDLAYVLRSGVHLSKAVATMLKEAFRQSIDSFTAPAEGQFIIARILHSVGAALDLLATGSTHILDSLAADLNKSLELGVSQWLTGLGVILALKGQHPSTLAADLRDTAIRTIGSSILASGKRPERHPRSSLRSDEIVWGRAPVRLDLGGGWSDTPPYSLENGGCVLNAAVNLNGQPPIQTYARVVPELHIRIRSIDLGDQVDITTLSDLNDYRNPTSSFGLVKAAFILAGFSREGFGLGPREDLPRLLEMFGGGIEMTTFAAVPKGSGLGTSSIMGAVITAVIQKLMGNMLTRMDLFHSVLRLEQALSTGGGWQDQIGGVIEGVKKVTTAPGLVPEADIHHIPADVLDPRKNGDQTLLYYTGITRLAKNILQKVVGRYLNRERSAVRTLAHMHAIPHQCADAMSRKDIQAFGELIDVSWRLNKQLDPDSSNTEVELLLTMLRPHLFGAKLLGAGGGGFLLLVCRSPEDACQARQLLTDHPPNERARLFRYDISTEGLVVTVS